MTEEVRELELKHAVYWEYSVSLTLSQNLMVYKRKTNGILDWMADWGGLFDGLTLIAQILTHHYSIYALRSFLAKSLVRVAPSRTENQGRKYKKTDKSWLRMTSK